MKVEYPKTEWKLFTQLPNSNDETIGPSGTHLWIWSKKDNIIFDYINWNNWSTKDYQKEHILNGDMWTYAIRPLPPKI